MFHLRGCPKTMKATKKLAQEFVEMDFVPNDRPLSERRLQVYERLLKAGSFRPVTWARAHCKETGSVYRVNGKHTSLLLSGLDEVPEFYVVIEDYDCSTLEDVAKLYGTFDSKLSARTSSEINFSFAGVIPELAGIGRGIIDVVVSGINYHKRLEQYASMPAVERAEVLIDNVEFAQFAHALIFSRDADRLLRRYPVIAAAYGTFQKNKAESLEFWRAVRDQTGPNPNVADRQLAKFLMLSTINGKIGGPLHRRATAREFYVKSILAWNAWRKDEAVKQLKFFKDGKVPNFG